MNDLKPVLPRYTGRVNLEPDFNVLLRALRLMLELGYEIPVRVPGFIVGTVQRTGSGCVINVAGQVVSLTATEEECDRYIESLSGRQINQSFILRLF